MFAYQPHVLGIEMVLIYDVRNMIIHDSLIIYMQYAMGVKSINGMIVNRFN